MSSSVFWYPSALPRPFAMVFRANGPRSGWATGTTSHTVPEEPWPRDEVRRSILTSTSEREQRRSAGSYLAKHAHLLVALADELLHGICAVRVGHNLAERRR